MRRMCVCDSDKHGITCDSLLRAIVRRNRFRILTFLQMENSCRDRKEM